MDAVDVVLIGCTVAAALLTIAVLTSIVLAGWRPRSRYLDHTVREPDSVTLLAPPRCKEIRNGGHTLVVRSLGCDRCSADALCHPVEATVDEVQRLERLRKDAQWTN